MSNSDFLIRSEPVAQSWVSLHLRPLLPSMKGFMTLSCVRFLRHINTFLTSANQLLSFTFLVRYLVGQNIGIDPVHGVPVPITSRCLSVLFALYYFVFLIPPFLYPDESRGLRKIWYVLSIPKCAFQVTREEVSFNIQLPHLLLRVISIELRLYFIHERSIDSNIYLLMLSRRMAFPFLISWICFLHLFLVDLEIAERRASRCP